MYNAGDLLKTKIYDFMYTCVCELFSSFHAVIISTNIQTYVHIYEHTQRENMFFWRKKNLNHH